MSTEPLDEIQWKSPEWIQQFGLHTGNVLDYFTESPFFDRTSNNQVLKMQFQFQQIPPNIHPAKYLQNKLTEMVGTEFTVAYTREPDFWVIRKQKRLNSTNVVPIQDYYIIGANVYQAPKIYDLLSSRMLASVLSLKKSVSLVNDMSQFSIVDGGHQYPSVDGTVDGSLSMLMSNTTNTTNTNANITPVVLNTPGTVGPTTVASSGNNVLSSKIEVPAAAFDNLLNSVVNSADQSMYLDERPLYGKGSTVELLSLKVNLDE